MNFSIQWKRLAIDRLVSQVTCSLAGALALFAAVGRAAQSDLPNIVLIMTDNHGAWTLGCYGNPDIKTPHIDRLAAEGTLFSRCYANNAVCSPTRATFLTGLMPCQHGVHRYLGARGAQIGPEAYNISANLKPSSIGIPLPCFISPCFSCDVRSRSCWT